MKKYTGIKGASSEHKFNLINEALDKYVLEEDIKKDLLEKIGELLEEFSRFESNNMKWDLIKDKLTSKQLLTIVERL